MKVLGIILALLLAMPVVVLAVPVVALEPDEILDDPVLEQRARDLSKVIRCVVCQNESIDSSNAEIAREVRLLVRERMVDGDTDQQVLDYLVARYGDFVLLRPPMKASTYLLWFGPGIVLVLGMIGVFVFFRRQRAAPVAAAPLSAEEEQRLSHLLGEPEETRPQEAGAENAGNGTAGRQ
ncbi:cytochrome c-type biogenesis protein CcmH [Pelagibius litoralis]|uniref:Cytochrome c-type biogenesis protein n=1 Tax=Pelagibius litoralis TaxID=374515 RepID=A0A967KBL1_9PROT|nr:cytochrome c-type biogenesis protein [Pelagibius litoralis]NIA72223.1 cytochrome c-type biogenesis protein CcmH [Pelagibius litoralis]